MIMNGPRLNVRLIPSGLNRGSSSGRCIAIAGLAAALLFGCKLDGGEPPEPGLQPQPQQPAVASVAAGNSEDSVPNAASASATPTATAATGAAATPAATEPKPEPPAEIDQLRDENRQLMQALDVTLANQQDLANQLRKTNEALAAIRGDVALVRERLHDLELAQESHPLPQRPPAGTAMAQPH